MYRKYRSFNSHASKLQGAKLVTQMKTTVKATHILICQGGISYHVRQQKDGSWKRPKHPNFSMRWDDSRILKVQAIIPAPKHDIFRHW